MADRETMTAELNKLGDQLEAQFKEGTATETAPEVPSEAAPKERAPRDEKGKFAPKADKAPAETESPGKAPATPATSEDDEDDALDLDDTEAPDARLKKLLTQYSPEEILSQFEAGKNPKKALSAADKRNREAAVTRGEAQRRMDEQDRKLDSLMSGLQALTSAKKAGIDPSGLLNGIAGVEDDPYSDPGTGSANQRSAALLRELAATKQKLVEHEQRLAASEFKDINSRVVGVVENLAASMPEVAGDAKVLQDVINYTRHNLFTNPEYAEVRTDAEIKDAARELIRERAGLFTSYADRRLKDWKENRRLARAKAAPTGKDSAPPGNQSQEPKLLRVRDRNFIEDAVKRFGGR